MKGMRSSPDKRNRGKRALSVTMAVGLLRRSKSPMLSCVGLVEIFTAAAIVKKSSHGGPFNLLVFGRQRVTRPSAPIDCAKQSRGSSNRSPHQCNHTKSIYCNTVLKGILFTRQYRK